jgi:hypothetical protein
MSEDFNLHLDDSAKRHSEQVFEGPTHDHGPSSHHESAPNYPSTLLGDSRLSGRGNAPVRTAVMQRMQQTVGNRAVQRFLQRAAADTAEASPQEDIGERIRSRAGGGSSLDTSTRGQLEENMGADLSGVRVHTDGEADSMARSVDAVAFTTGNDIFFRSGTYNPESTDGMRLLAHEATHTVQQAQGPVSGTPAAGGVSISDPSDSFEQAAESNAAKVVSRMAAGGSGGSVEGGAVQRQEGESTSVQRESEGAEEEEEQPAQTMRTSTYASAAVQRQEGAEEEEEEPAQTMRASTYSSMSVQRQEGAEEEEEEPAQTMRASTYASTAVQRESEGAEEEEEQPAQAMRASTYASTPVQRESEGAEEEEEQPAQTMRTSTYSATVQRQEGAEEEEEEPAQTMRASTYASTAVQRHAGHEEEVNG